MKIKINWHCGVRTQRLSSQHSNLDEPSGAKALVFRLANATAEAATHKDPSGKSL
jgi:hypothetical protein